MLYWVVSANFCALGQERNTDNLQLHQTEVNMVNGFNKAIGQQSRLFNGPAYISYNFNSKTNANFKDTTAFNIGTVNYDGIVYTNVPLMYDLHRDLLISQLTNGILIYSFISEKVYTFDLLDHHFVQLQADSVNKQMDVGFYDELYHHKLRLLARRTKNLQQEASGLVIDNVFISKTSYYLKKGNTYYNVNSQGKFFDVLKDKKKELKQYLKDNKIRFRDNPERAMVTLAAYYDHLTN